VKELGPQINADRRGLKRRSLSSFIGVHRRPDLFFFTAAGGPDRRIGPLRGKRAAALFQILRRVRTEGAREPGALCGRVILKRETCKKGLSPIHMPLYEYRCQGCGKTFEVIQKFSDDPLTVHEACGGPVERLLSAPALQFKGSGWYVTDYGRQGKSPSTNGKSEAKTESKTESKAESKTETKSETSGSTRSEAK
jgi:putative FmdB family regulatory protein